MDEFDWLISSGFMKGPWGPKTLCVVHYVAWFRTKKLDLSAYVRIVLMISCSLNFLQNLLILKQIQNLSICTFYKQRNKRIIQNNCILEIVCCANHFNKE